ARRIHEHDLGLVHHRHASDDHAGGLDLGADDLDLRSHQDIGESGFAGIGGADDGAETASGGHDTRASNLAAASCSASRLEPPSPVSGAMPSTEASITKCGACAGPLRPASR